MELVLGDNQFAFSDRELIEARNRALDKIIDDELFFVPGGGERFGKNLRPEQDLVKPMGIGEIAGNGEALLRFLEVAGLLPRLRELETSPGEFVGERG